MEARGSPIPGLHRGNLSQNKTDPNNNKKYESPLPWVYEAPFTQEPHKKVEVVHTCNPCSQRVEAGKSEVPDYTCGPGQLALQETLF